MSNQKLELCFLRGNCHWNFFDPQFLSEQKFSLIDVKFAHDVDPIELFTALPSFRTLTTAAFDFLGRYVGYNDALLRSLATHGFWNVPVIENAQVTDAGVLDFAFGAHVDAEGGRRLELSAANKLSPQFLSNVVQVRIRDGDSSK